MAKELNRTLFVQLQYISNNLWLDQGLGTVGKNPTLLQTSMDWISMHGVTFNNQHHGYLLRFPSGLVAALSGHGPAPGSLGFVYLAEVSNGPAQLWTFMSADGQFTTNFKLMNVGTGELVGSNATASQPGQPIVTGHFLPSNVGEWQLVYATSNAIPRLFVEDKGADTFQQGHSVRLQGSNFDPNVTYTLYWTNIPGGSSNNAVKLSPSTSGAQTVTSDANGTISESWIFPQVWRSNSPYPKPLGTCYLMLEAQSSAYPEGTTSVASVTPVSYEMFCNENDASPNPPSHMSSR